MTRSCFCLLLAATFTVASLARADDEKKGGKDQDFVTKAAQGGIAEVAAGKVASKRASNDDVKMFAKMMVDDHTKANKELMKLAGKKYDVPKKTDEEHEKELATLKKLTGVVFDRTYMAGQVKDHKEAVELFAKEAKDGSDPELKKWAEKTLPALRKHLKKAQEVHGKLKGGTGTGTSKPGDK